MLAQALHALPRPRPGWGHDAGPLITWFALITLAWSTTSSLASSTADAWWWPLRAEAITLTGLLAIGMMSLAMLLATRPVWLERPLGGLDRIYRLHRRAGVLAGVFALAHWLMTMADEPILAFFGNSGRPQREHGGALFEALRDLAKELGEWAIYALLAMLVLSLLRRVPFRPWRWLHRAMPLLYLILAFHAALLMPPDNWSQAPGLLSGSLLAIGSIAAVLSLSGRIGQARRYAGKLMTFTQPAPGLTEIDCRIDGWPGHQAGQFALLTLHPEEGSHPFTIAAADHGDGRLRFDIKALGDYTRQLAERLVPGQTVSVEGPYGRFTFRPQHAGTQRQLWIAGGIGITPFLAALEALQRGNDDGPPAGSHIELHYACHDATTDPFVTRLSVLCADLPEVTLAIHETRHGERFSIDTLPSEQLRKTELWFCGPAAFARAVRTQLRARGLAHVPFHQEAFEFR